MFYAQLLCAQIPKAQKDTDDLTDIFALLRSLRVKSFEINVDEIDYRKWWKARNSRGHVGHVPHTIVEVVEEGQEVVSRPPHAGPPRHMKTSLPQQQVSISSMFYEQLLRQ